MPRFNFTFQEASPLITYTGLWMEGNPANDTSANLYDGSFRVTNTTAAKAAIDFKGTGVTIFGAFRDNHGNYTVDLDDGESSIKNGGHPDAFKQPLWQAYDLANGPHTVEVTNVPSSSGPYFDLDYVTIERTIGEDSDTIFNYSLDDTSPFVQYGDGSWQSSVSLQDQNYNDTSHQTTAIESRLTITFPGCCIELYGTYANAVYTVSLDNQAAQTMQGLDVDLSRDMWHSNTLLYLVDGLSEDVNHTVSITTIQTTAQRPFFFDCARVRSTHNRTSLVTPPSTTDSSVPGNSARSAKNTPPGVIVGITLSAAVFLALLGAVYIFLRRRKRSERWASHQFGVEPYNPMHQEVNSLGQPQGQTATPVSMVIPSSVSGDRRRTLADEPNPNSASQQIRHGARVEHSSNNLTDTKVAHAPSAGQAGSSTLARSSEPVESSMPAGSSILGSNRDTNEVGELVPVSTEMHGREEDAGVTLGETFPTSTLPPAYDPDWDQRS